jgi:hypothetical protein
MRETQSIFFEGQEKVFMGAITETVVGHPITVDKIIDFLYVIGKVADIGMTPIQLLKLVENAQKNGLVQ